MDEKQLKDEAIVISRYLIGSLPHEELIDRYIKAHRFIPDLQPRGRNKKGNDIIFTYPAMLPFIDTVLGLLEPGSVIRKKILTMSAILETSPVYEKFFLYSEKDPFKIFLEIIRQMLFFLTKLVIGLPIYIFVKFRKI
jgi:hypothetical protein